MSSGIKAGQILTAVRCNSIGMMKQNLPRTAGAVSRPAGAGGGSGGAGGPATLRVQEQLGPGGLLLDLQPGQGTEAGLFASQPADLRFCNLCVCVGPDWIHQVVKAAQRVSVRSSETQSSVEISEACPADSGSYTIVVRNREGSAKHAVSLSVIGEATFGRSSGASSPFQHPHFGFSADRPDPPASQPVVSQLTAQSLVLSWTGPSYDGGKAVQGYTVEVQPEGEAWAKLATRCKSTSYHARSGLDPLGNYRFRVRAYNSAGVSDPSQESEWVKMATTSKPLK